MSDLFTKAELYTLASGLDALVRAEGSSLAANGIAGLQNSLGQLNLRFSACVTAHAKLVDIINTPEPAPSERPAPEPVPPLVQEPATRGKRVAESAAAH